MKMKMLKILIAREPFAKAVAAVHRVTDSRQTLPILSHLLLEATPAGILLAGTDLSVGLRMELAAEVYEPGAVALPARKLAEIVHTLPDAPICLETVREGEALLACERARFRLRALSADEFPRFPEPSDDGLALPATALADLVAKTSFAVSPDQSRWALTGICLEATADQLRFTATDGRRLAVATLPQGNGRRPLSALVPPKALTAAARLTAASAGDVRLALDAEGQQLLLVQGGLRINARVLDGQFPNVAGVVPEPGPEMIAVDREALRAALRRVTPLLGASWGTTLTPGETTFTLSGSDPALGEAREEVDARIAGDVPALAVHARYLLDFLEATDASEIRLYIRGPLDPVLLVPADRTDYQYVLMPMRGGEST
jgi:DNA polymerase-3 subunit beta